MTDEETTYTFMATFSCLLCLILQRNIGTSNAEDKANAGATEDETNLVVANGSKNNIKLKDKEEAKSSSNLVFGYLNLISDGVV